MSNRVHENENKACKQFSKATRYKLRKLFLKKKKIKKNTIPLTQQYMPTEGQILALPCRLPLRTSQARLHAACGLWPFETKCQTFLLNNISLCALCACVCVCARVCVCAYAFVLFLVVNTF